MAPRHCEERNGEAIQTRGVLPGLLCSARNDGRTIVIARRRHLPTTKQSSRRKPSPWIASLRSQ
ncbi:MAG: hypothetical protein LBT00_08430 [Spirochaetaceae bacterium]|nr:hypothetical protein [Spirochaetaceae bacterium]